MEMMFKMPPEQLAAMQTSIRGGATSAPTPASGPDSAVQTSRASALPAGAAADEPALLQPGLEAMMQNPEMMKAAGDMMASMTPEQMAAMSAAAYTGQGPGGPAADGGPGGMAAMLDNPDAMRAVRDMMKSISPEQMAAMARASGQDMTPEQVLGLGYPAGSPLICLLTITICLPSRCRLCPVSRPMLGLKILQLIQR